MAALTRSTGVHRRQSLMKSRMTAIPVSASAYMSRVRRRGGDGCDVGHRREGEPVSLPVTVPVPVPAPAPQFAHSEFTWEFCGPC
jgi:hypothetical protein